MKNMVDIDVVIDEKYIDPKVTIKTKEKSEQVENIIYAIENVSDNDFPVITAQNDRGKTDFISQRDIVRVYTGDRRVVVDTENGSYSTKRSLSSLEEILNKGRFIRISQSEIVNLKKVKGFDINIAGTIGIEFDDGRKVWASRSRVRAIKALIKG